MLYWLQGELKWFLYKELVHTLFYAEIILRCILGFGMHIRAMYGLGNIEEATNTGSETPSGRLLKLFSQTMPKNPVSFCLSCKDRVYICVEASL